MCGTTGEHYKWHFTGLHLQQVINSYSTFYVWPLIAMSGDLDLLTSKRHGMLYHCESLSTIFDLSFCDLSFQTNGPIDKVQWAMWMLSLTERLMWRVTLSWWICKNMFDIVYLLCGLERIEILIVILYTYICIAFVTAVNDAVPAHDCCAQ